MTRRPLNKCKTCGYTWHPRGHSVSRRCPSCGSTEVGVASSCLSQVAVLVLIAGAVYCCLEGRAFGPQMSDDRGAEATVGAEDVLSTQPVRRTPEMATTPVVPWVHPTVDVTECTLGAVFEADITMPDNTRIEIGQSFVKTWRIRNTGSCTWVRGYRWTFVGGEQMSGPSSVRVPTTQPGESVEVSATLIAPTEGGQHRGYWQMCVNGDECFGERVFVQIVSFEVPSVAPTPTHLSQTLGRSKGSFEVRPVAFLSGRDLEADLVFTTMQRCVGFRPPRTGGVCARA
jgi:predicted RNA-binding Zn-ribbon protein involved in translation (DUF1610 family)